MKHDRPVIDEECVLVPGDVGPGVGVDRAFKNRRLTFPAVHHWSGDVNHGLVWNDTKVLVSPLSDKIPSTVQGDQSARGLGYVDISSVSG